MKLLFGFIIGLAILAIVVALYCAMLLTGRSDKNNNNNEGYDDMFCKEQLCPNCRTGKESYELDQYSESCPYIGYLKKGTCSFFVPFEDAQNGNVQEK